MTTHVSELEDFGVFQGEAEVRLDLACGDRKKDGFVGVDIAPIEGAVDIVHDLNVYPYPFEDSSVFEINCSHFIEHVADIKAFMDECWRIMKSKGLMMIKAPYWSSMRAHQDFTHVRLISENTFVYFSEAWRKKEKLEHYGVKANFEVASCRFVLKPEWMVRGAEAQEWARQHLLNTVEDIEITLRAIK